jgi:hypothetical protein
VLALRMGGVMLFHTLSFHEQGQLYFYIYSIPMENIVINVERIGQLRVFSKEMCAIQEGNIVRKIMSCCGIQSV